MKIQVIRGSKAILLNRNADKCPLRHLKFVLMKIVDATFY